jgi:Protein of unknown function (DUF3237)
MIELQYEMTYLETIDGPLASTKGSPGEERLCWQVTSGSLQGPRINATVVIPGTDWMRLGTDGLRRPDMRIQLTTGDGAVILFHYDNALIRPTPEFLAALAGGGRTAWTDQYMRMVPKFEVGAKAYSWLNQSLFIGVGRVAGRLQIEYAIYRVE